MIDAYVARSFDRPELDYVYYTERLNMTVADQNVLRILQLSTVESWVQLVVAVRPEWTPGTPGSPCTPRWHSSSTWAG